MSHHLIVESAAAEIGQGTDAQGQPVTPVVRLELTGRVAGSGDEAFVSAILDANMAAELAGLLGRKSREAAPVPTITPADDNQEPGVLDSGEASPEATTPDA